MSKVNIYIAAFAAASMLLPYASQTVFGAATTTAKVNDELKVGVFVDQVDSGLTELTVAIPFTPGSLEFARLEPGPEIGGEFTANVVIVNDSSGSVNTRWVGTLPLGATGHIGNVVFRVKKADKSEFQGRGVNPFAKDANGTRIMEVNVTNSEAIVQLSPRPLKINIDLTVVPK